MTTRTIKIGTAALRGPMRVLSVALSAVFLLILGHFWNLSPAYEASSVLQIRPGGESVPLIESRLFTRGMLETTAERHGVASPVALTQAIALHPLTTEAGQSLGMASKEIGLIVTVRLDTASRAMRVANDVALQIMDLAQAGQVDAQAERLSLLRSEDYRLWQEVSALRSDPSRDALADRTLARLEAEHEVVLANLAQQEVRARINAALKAPPYAILSRAQTAQAVTPPVNEALAALAAGALLLALLSTLIGREISWPLRRGPSADTGRSRSS